MSDLADSIALAHRVTLVDQNAGTTKCACGVWTPSRASEGMLDVQGRHVAEVAEALVKAQGVAALEQVASDRSYDSDESITEAYLDAARIVARGESS